MPGENPEGASGEAEIEASQWRAVFIAATLEDGSLLELDLLRPVAWVHEHDVKIGADVPVKFGETETKRGSGKVKRINPCPPLRAGPGHTVTGVFRHVVPEILTVSTNNGERSNATPEHPFWSEDRQAFVPAKDLQSGERLRHLAGETTVASIASRPAQETVYNLEVHGSHAFHVGQSGLLVHNCGKLIENPNWKSVKQFGHAFNTHGAGEKNTRRLMDRAKGTGQAQGQWLDNQKAADFLGSLDGEMADATVKIPEGLGQVIKPDGTIVNAEWARVIISPSGIRTAFPVIP